MITSRTRRAFLASCGASILAAACGRSGTDNAANPGAQPVEAVLNRGNVGEPSSLDPHFITSTYEDAIVGEMLMGLTTQDAQGRPIPGAALSWETSADGKTWTFHLRDHQWSDGKTVTADDFVFAWRRILDPKTAAVYAQILYGIKNAQAINAGEMPPDALGARAVDDATLELQLENPAGYLPELMMHATSFPLPRHVVEAKGMDWAKAENYVANGPYTLVEWVPNDHIALRKNPRFYDAANVKIDRVNFYPIQDPDAGLRRFRAGELDIQGSIPTNQVAFLKQNMADNLHMEPYMGTGFLLMNQTHKPLNDVRVRQALNLAYDRETMAEKVLGTGQVPAYSLVPAGVANYPGGAAFDFKDTPYPDRVKRAQALMRAAGYGPNRHLKLSMAAGVGADARRVAAAVQEIWKAAYIDADIVQTDAQVYSHNLQTGDFDVAAYGWSADFNDARNFLYLFMSDNPMNYGRYSNRAFDTLMNRSDAEQDLAKRAQLLVQAEQLLLKDAAAIPNRFLVTTDLVQTYVKGWISNLNNTNRTRWLSIEKPPAQPAK